MKVHNQEINQTSFSEIVNGFLAVEAKLQENSYLHDTTKRLSTILEDANTNLQILIIGKERVGKTSIINALLGRELLCPSTEMPTEVNTFIKFSEDERIEAHFFDGYKATFNLDKLPLLMNSNDEIAAIIREHIDYLAVYAKQELLKRVQFIDTRALEILDNKSVYFSHQLLNRADVIFCVQRGDSSASDEEIQFIQKISEKYSKPYILINTTTHMKQNVYQFIQQEQMRYGQFTEGFHIISAEKALDARKTNNTQSLIDSNITGISNLLDELSMKDAFKYKNVMKHLNEWLARFHLEVQILQNREPYISAVESTQKYLEELKAEHSREKRDLAIIQTYEIEYEQTAILFKEVQTLYQLLQVIGGHYYLRNELIDEFEQVAINYHQQIRSYRSLHSEYNQAWSELRKNVKKSNEINQELHVTISTKAHALPIEDKIILLNDKQEILSVMYRTIKQLEQALLDLLKPTEQCLMELLNKRLEHILNQVDMLNNQRVHDYKVTVSYINKLKEFNCVYEVQNLLYETIKPILEQSLTQEHDSLVMNMLEKVDEIYHVPLFHQQLVDEVVVDESLTEAIIVNFAQNYEVFHIQLTTEDIVSNIPAIPFKIVRN